jgi:GNAT superfamily N-acetyltransferase
VDAVLEVRGRSFRVDRATEADVPRLLALLADDALGARRESDDPAPYLAAFAQIDADPSHLLVAVRSDDGSVVATMQLTLLPGLSRAGSTRLQVEGVRVAPEARGGGLGAALMGWAHEWGAARGATVVQLTSDRSRTGAHRFYERLGYEPSHVGFKRPL